MIPERPLDRVSSIKVKLALLVLVSIAASALLAAIGRRAGVPSLVSVPVAMAMSLVITQWLAHGMVAPLSDMTRAARRMAAGDLTQRVTTTSTDEVGVLARSFNQMARDLADQDRQRRQLIATVSHELRTPLAAQRALLENLVDGVVQPTDTSLGTALTQAERLSDLVRDLLDLARLDSGALTLTPERIELAELLRSCVAEADLGPRDVRHTVVVEPPDLTVTADRARLSQVIANLLDNADRHSPEGEVVEISARREAEQWVLDVTDRGAGIPADERHSIFERFGAPGHLSGGTGIGLAVASWVVELHGGTIRALDPTHGDTGACLSVRLPLQPLPSAAPLKGPEMPPSPKPAPIPAAPERATAPGASSPPLTTSLLDEIFGHAWRERTHEPQPLALGGSLMVGLLGALLLPDTNRGLGLFLVILAGGGLAWWLAVRRRERWTLICAVLAVLLASFTVLREDPQLVVCALFIAGILVSSGLIGTRRLTSVLLGPLAWVLAGVRGLPLLGTTLTTLSKRASVWALVRTIAVSLIALIVFGALFSSADALFGSWASQLVPDLAWDSLIARVFVFVFIGGVVLTACYLALNPPREELLPIGSGRPVAKTWEWLAPVATVIALFALFLVAQATAMWGGHDYLLRTTGLTYAEYVHQGFGQLTVATALTLLVIALVGRKATRSGEHPVRLAQIAVAVLCVLTLVVVASALYRMHLYQQAFGFTVLRVWVDAFELWLGVVVALVLGAWLRRSHGWVARAALVAGAGTVLVLGAMNVQGWVAQRNIARYHATGSIDVDYLASLTVDAVPTISESDLPQPLKACALGGRLDQASGSLVGYNVARERAEGILAARTLRDPSVCSALSGNGNGNGNGSQSR